MKGLVYEAPWELRVRELPDVPPQAGEVTVTVRASGVCGSDVHGFTGSTGRRTPPVVMGHEVAGVIAEVGQGVTATSVGDRVVLKPLLSCGVCPPCRTGQHTICLDRRLLGGDIQGGYAERVTLPAQMAFPLPDGVDWPVAALAEPLSVAMHAVNRTPIELFDTVVVIGAGAIGILAMLAAQLRGAGTIVVSDRSAHRLEVARRLGADVTVNVSEQELRPVVADLTDGLGAAAVIEAVGLPATSLDSVAVCRSGGNVTWIGNSEPRVDVEMQELVTRELTLRGAYGADAEFSHAVEALASERVAAAELIELVAPLEEGPDLITRLAKAEIDPIKVVLLAGP
ncbi:MAG TPA: alcohol dehydrogenase catalytic domain-containing protein [Egibacteraceae bacterium]|nr:alcohol dehydrogenase catalytic domain-containing protein [Egibacteraceae bacterium]